MVILQAPTNPGTADWLVGVILDSSLDVGLPPGTIVRDPITGELFVSTSEDPPTYTQLTGNEFEPSGITLIHGGATTPFATITLALAAAVSGDTVIVGPGTYAESITIPAGVAVVGSPPSQLVQIVGAAATGSRITLNPGSVARDLSVTAPSAGAAPAIDAFTSLTSGQAALYNVLTVGSTGTGAIVKGAGAGGSLVLLSFYQVAGAHAGPFIEAAAGTVNFNGVGGNAGSSTDLIKVTGAEVTGLGVLVTPAYTAVDGIEISGGSFQADGVVFPQAEVVTNAVHISADGVLLGLSGAHLQGSVWDLLVNGGLVGTNTSGAIDGDLRIERMSAPDAWLAAQPLQMTVIDAGQQDEPSIRMLGSEFTVGLRESPKGASIGEGDSTTRNMQVWSNDGAVTWVDNTAAAASRTGPPFSLLQGTAAGNAAYFGSPAPFPALRIDTATAQVNGVLGTAVWEVWTGAAWTALAVMSTDADYPYDQHAQEVFVRTDAEQIRYNVDGAAYTAWAASDPGNGETLFWMRYRVTVAITTVATLNRVRIGVNRSEINRDGFLEWYGVAEPRHTMQVHQRLADPLTGATPTNGSLALTTNISLTLSQNQFADNALDGFGIIVPVDPGLDTSRPLTFIALWAPNNNVGGNVELEINYGVLREGSVMDGTIANSNVPVVVAVLNQQNVLIRTEFTLSIPDIVPGEFIALSFFRDARAGNVHDTYTSSIRIAEISMHGKSWHA